MQPTSHTHPWWRARQWTVALAVFIAGLLLTAAIATRLNQVVDLKDHERFDNAVEQCHATIADRIDTYVSILRGAAGFVSASPNVNRNSFAAFANRLRLREFYPGVMGLGFSVRVPPAQQEAWLKSVRADGVTSLRPGEAPRPFEPWANDPAHELHSIVYIEPLDARNHHAIGYNMFSEPVRHAAMEQARDQGVPFASGPVRLVQDPKPDAQAGFLIYVPVYHGGGVPETVDDRRDKLVGFVYGAFRAEDVLADVFEGEHHPQIKLAVYDGEKNPEHLLFQSPHNGHQPRLTKQSEVDIVGRRWLMEFANRPEFEFASSKRFVPLGLFAGIVVSSITSLLAWRETRARSIAEQKSKELVASSARQRSTLEGAIDCIVSMDHHGKVIEFNPAAERTFGYNREDVIGKLMCELIIPDEHRESHRAGLKRYLTSGLSNILGKRLSLTAVRKSGHEFPVELTVTRNPGDGQPTFTGFLRDVSELKIAEKRLLEEAAKISELYEAEQQARAIAEKATADKESMLETERAARRTLELAGRMKDEFLATLSHELRTPLNAVLGFSTYLRRATPSAEELNSGLETIERNARAQATLIEDLLDMNRIISGKLRLDVQPVDLATVIEAALDTVRTSADSKGIRIQKVLDLSNIPMRGDPGRLQQVVWNLLSNAIKFTPKGGIVQIRLERVNSYVELSVVDSGQGIEQEFLPRVFDRFSQADGSTTRTHGGLGLGLSIVRQLIELHGGSVRAESSGLNEGSSFIVSLPVAIVHGDVDAAGRVHPTTHAPHRANHHSLDLSGVQALVVDDDVDACSLVKRILEERKATVHTAHTAAEALQLIVRERPDVLLSDIGMPVEDGYDLIRQVRALEPNQGRDTPAAALTAFARSEDRTRAALAGFQTHIAKPVEAGELVAIVANLTGRADRSPRSLA